MDERLLKAEAIVFDVGNVLLSFDRDRMMALLPEDKRAPMMKAMFGTPCLWPLFDLGAETNEEIARKIGAAAGIPQAKEMALYLVEHFPETMAPLPLAGQLDALRAMGKRLYALTNYPEPSFTITCRRFPFLTEKLDGAVVSAREKLVKPDPAIFRLIAQRYALDPEKSLFIDDIVENTLGAREVGFHTWHYTEKDWNL